MRRSASSRKTAAQLMREQAAAASYRQAHIVAQIQLQPQIIAKEAFKRPMVRDMFALAYSVMTEEGMIGNAGYASQAAALEAVAAAHDQMVDQGAATRVLPLQEAAANSYTHEDCRWLCSQLHADVRNEPLDVWRTMR